MLPDVFYGTSGNDLPPPTSSYQYLYGYGGNDELQMSYPGYGEVHGGAGFDIVYMHPYTPQAYGLVHGGSGRDYALGGAKADQVYGDKGNDYVDGRAGNDSVYGGGGRDRVEGGVGNDHLFGGKGDDSGKISVPGSSMAQGDPLFFQVSAGLFGGDGNDHLFGGAGDDKLHGGNDDDVLVGGKGRDQMWGDAGLDTFRFESVKDSLPDSSHRDVIKDFQTGDLIDLKAIDANTGKPGNQAFKFIGTDSFNDKAGELHYVHGVLAGDVNGDGTADFAVKLHGHPALTVDDFVL
jgi:Ca2+-binding RTX toxin-like protein